MQGDRYFTSDLHFHHKRITEFTARKDFTTAEDHTEWLITLWNSQVKKGDTVWHLGDFSFSSKYEEIEAVVKRLNGQKFFIKGNHCKESVFKKLLQNNLLQKFQQYEEIKIQGNTTCLFHFPITSWHKQGYGSWHIHGHCVDDQTEILTQKGWKYFGDFQIGDFVYSYNALKDKAELTPIEDIISVQYTGDVYVNNRRSTDFRVTKGHTLVYWYGGKYKETPVECVPKTIRASLITSADADKQGLSLTASELRLYICIASDGSIKEETNLCRIRVKKLHKIQYIRQLLIDLGIPSNEYRSDKYVSFNFYIPKSLTGWNFKGLDEKLRSASKHDCKIIIDAYCHADGHRQPNGVIIYSQKENEINLLQEIFVTGGFMATKYSRQHGFGTKMQHQLSVTKNTRQSIRCKNLIVEKVSDEHFWCIKTKNQSFFIRRNGKVSVTGNCHGSFQGQGKILDVGLDNAYKVLGEHRFFTENDIQDFMNQRDTVVQDHHKVY